MAEDQLEALSIVKIATVGNGVQEIAFAGETMPLADALEQANLDLDGVNKVRVEDPAGGKTEYDADKVEDVVVKDGDKVFLKPAIRGG